MGNLVFKSDGFTPIVRDEKNLASEDQVKKAQSYVDQIASHQTEISRKDWAYMRFDMKEQGGVYFKVCFHYIGPYCLDPIHDGFENTKEEQNLRLQTEELRKWIPSASNLHMSIFRWSEIYCIDFPLDSKN